MCILTRSRILQVVLTAALMSWGTARGAFYEPFDYSSATLGGQNGGSGFTGAWSNDPSNLAIVTGLTYGPLVTAGGAAADSDNTAYNPVRNTVTSFAGSGKTFWYSMLVNTQASGVGTLRVRLGTQLTGGSNGYTLVLNDSTSDSAVTLSVRRGDNTMADLLGSSFKFNAATTYLIVAKVETGDQVAGGSSETMTLWVLSGGVIPSESALASVPNVSGVSAKLTGSSAGPVAVSTGIRLESLATATWTVDELRLGTTYDSVVPVPEPAAAGGLILGLMVLAGGRRRRNAGLKA